MFRLAISGRSMEPALRDGDWVIVRRLRRLPRVGELIALRDPFDERRLLVKRVASVGESGIEIGSDSAAHAAHFAVRGSIPERLILGRPVFRYAPLRRLGPVS